MKKKTRAIVLGVVLLLLLGTPVVVWLGWGGWWVFIFSHENPFTYLPETEGAIRATHASGDQIVAALERWKAKTGSYPASLVKLVPSELVSIPQPDVGNGKWSYTLRTAQSFQLLVWVGPDYESDWWRSDGGHWDVDR